MTGEYMEPDGEFHLVTRADGTVGIVPSMASIEATCQAAGIERMPDPCIQCAKCTGLQTQINAMLACVDEVRDSALELSGYVIYKELVATWLDAISNAGKAVSS